MSPEDFELTFARNNTLQAFRAFYPNAEACYTDYARRMADKFSAVSPTCDCCGSQERVCCKAAKWEINYQNSQSNRRNLFGLLLLLVGHVHLAKAVLQFETKHSICKRCLSSFSLKRLFAVPASFVATLFSYLPVVVTVLGGLFVLIGLLAGEKIGIGVWSVVIGAAAMILPCYWHRRQLDLLTIPAILRPIAKDPIVFRGFSAE